MTVDDVITAWATDRPAEFVLAVEAHKLVERLREDDPDTLAKWLDDRAEEVVARELQHLVASDRGRSSRRQGARAFAKFREAQEAAGQPLAWGDFAHLTYCVDDGNRWKPLVDMTAPECLYVAEDRERRAEANRLEAALMRAVAKRLKKGQTVAEAYTPDQLAALLG